MTKAKKILLVQTANSNLGDNVIADNHEYLIRKIAGSRDIKVFNYSISSRDIDQIKYVDAVVFAGGILKITNEKFHIYIPEIIRAAQEANVPVYLSSIGVEKFYEEDERSIELKEALNLPCVKGVGVRDDIETFKKDYLTDKSQAGIWPVYDVAVWSSKTYKDILTKRKNPKPVIGIGVVRHKLFSDYGHPEVTKEMQMEFWTGVISKLDELGLDWAIFTNGDRYDEEMAREVLAAVGHGAKLDTPLDSKALVKMISGFDGVIAGRMHSNIIAYALGIPSIGFVWNQKLRFWANKIGYPERFMETDEMSSEKAVSLLTDAMKRKCGPNRKILGAVYKPLKKFIKKQVPWHEYDAKAPIDDSLNVLCADHMGSLRVRYPGTNSIQALNASASSGYKNFRLDLRLTTDGKLVCVKQWSAEVYKTLGFDCSEMEDPSIGLDYETFRSLKYNDRFNTSEFSEMLDAFNGYKDIFNIILSFGQPKEEIRDAIISQISETLKKYPDFKHNIIICAERKADLEVIRSVLPQYQSMYYFVPSRVQKEDAAILKKANKKALDYARENNITYFALGSGLHSKAKISDAHSNGLKYCVFTNDKLDMINDAITGGADLVINSTYPPDYLRSLMKP